MANYKFRIEVRNDENDGLDIYFPMAIADNVFMDKEMTKTLTSKLIEMIDSLTDHKSSSDHDTRYYPKALADSSFLKKTENAVSSSKLKDARVITFTGNTSGSATFDGSKNITVSLSVANDSHTHDTRYYTESEMNTMLGNKSSVGHAHDDRYYTESEMNSKLAGKANSSHTHSASQANIYAQYSAPAHSKGRIWIDL